MNILYHHRTQAKGAEGVHIREIVKALEAEGNKVFVVSPPGVDIFLDSFDEQNIDKQPRLSGFWKLLSKHVPQIVFELMEICYNFAALHRLNEVLKREKIDFLYERNAFFCWAGVKLANKYNIPIIIEVNEISGVKRVRGQIFKRLAKRIEKNNFLNASAIIVVSQFLKRQIASLGVDDNKICVIPNGVNLHDFHPDVEKNPDIIRKYGLNNKTVLGFVGGFVAWHNFDFLIECFKNVVEICLRQDIVLVLVGDGPQRDLVEKQVRNADLSDKVIFTGNISHKDISQYIQLMDICIIPHSNEYRSPIKLFEYMAMSKAVIAPKLEPIEAIVIDNIDGKLFNQNDKDSFVAATLEIIMNTDKRASIAMKAGRKIRERYLWKNNAITVIGIANKVKLYD